VSGSKRYEQRASERIETEKKILTVWTIEPRRYWYCIIGMENVRGRGIVEDDSVTYRTTELREVFDIVALVVIATLSEQPVCDNTVDIQLVQHRVGVLKEPVSFKAKKTSPREITTNLG
jgi:hypothetical protein